jgi:ankyrin repeat protein
VVALLELGADPNIQSNDGCTALHFVSCVMTEEFITILLQYGADRHIKNDKGKMPWHLLSSSDPRVRDLVKPVRWWEIWKG